MNIDAAVICSVIAMASSVICTFITTNNLKNKKEEDRQKQLRAEEGKLQLAMISANMMLTIGIAHSLGRDHATDEILRGLASVEEANKEYRRFVDELTQSVIN